MTMFLAGFFAGFVTTAVGLIVWALVTDRRNSPADYMED